MSMMYRIGMGLGHVANFLISIIFAVYNWQNQYARFDPDRDGIPGPQESGKTSCRKKAKAKPQGKVHNIAGRRFLETDGDTGLEWVNLDSRIETGRVAGLTDADKTMIEYEGLEIDKAEFLKPFWADELTNSQILKAVNGEGERYGLGERTIKKYTSVFSRAAGIETDKT